MSVYAEIGGNFQQVGGTCPDGWVEMSGQRPDDEDTLLYTATQAGEWVISDETLARIGAEREVAWVEEEMPVAAEQLIMLEDEDPAALPGTARQWRDYRIALRAWKDGAAGYPQIELRPARPA
ncbi:hypothetical protein HU720_08135 [Pseudomonas sp. SWRI51]|uniref:hypothetical protein n=1 Tax=Pseudomonas sp. SWRI51 TaxID=2745491 RepID=UPI0016492F9D|nr:hypothetical protein [Pseudomonas sp. SWRI51]MBC3411271.1 hypothetical protein [Pseudomonas sp. SWRI51]